MKTKTIKLVFDKASVTELNDYQENSVKGGGTTIIIDMNNPTGYVCSNCVSHSIVKTKSN